MKLITCHSLVQWLRMNGALLWSAYVPSWHGSWSTLSLKKCQLLELVNLSILSGL